MWRLRRHWMPMNGHGRSPAPRGGEIFCFSFSPSSAAYGFPHPSCPSGIPLPSRHSPCHLPSSSQSPPYLPHPPPSGHLLVVAKSASVRASAGRPRSAPLLLLSPADPLRWALPGPHYWPNPRPSPLGKVINRRTQDLPTSSQSPLLFGLPLVALAPLPCSSSPQQTRFAGLCRGPIIGRTQDLPLWGRL